MTVRNMLLEVCSMYHCEKLTDTLSHVPTYTLACRGFSRWPTPSATRLPYYSLLSTSFFNTDTSFNTFLHMLLSSVFSFSQTYASSFQFRDLFYFFL
jgi:hypothetical protein